MIDFITVVLTLTAFFAPIAAYSAGEAAGKRAAEEEHRRMDRRINHEGK